MRVCKVIGTVVASQKDEKLAGAKLLVVRDVDLETNALTGAPTVAIDTVGAGVGTTVLVVGGSSARLTERTKNAPVDLAVVGIIDTIDVSKPPSHPAIQPPER